MSVFDGKIKTEMKVAAPRTDHKLPHPGSLSLKCITEKSALSGTNGLLCNLVHGDHWHEVRGTEINNVTVDQRSTISRNQTVLVKGNHKETLVGNCYQNIIGPHLVQNNNVRNETRLAKWHLVYGDNEQSQDNSSNFWMVANSFTFVPLFNLEVDGVAKIEFAGVHLETKLVHLTADLVDIQAVYAVSIQAACQLAIALAGTSVQFSRFAVHTRAAIDTKMCETDFWVGAAKFFAGPIAGPNQIF